MVGVAIQHESINVVFAASGGMHDTSESEWHISAKSTSGLVMARMINVAHCSTYFHVCTYLNTVCTAGSV